MSTAFPPPSAPIDALQLTFDDEFTTFANSPDGSVGWQTRFPYYGATARNLGSVGEIQYYSDSSVGVNPFSDTGGVLGITASKSTNTAKSGGQPYVSGAITTDKSFSQEYGYFEARVQVPAGSGFWSAFWLQPDSLDGLSELDGFEILGKEIGKSSGNDINYTVHYKNPDGSGAQDSTRNDRTLDGVPISDPANGFHTYGVDWEPTGVTWYYDGVAIKTHTGALGHLDEKMFISLNLAVGAAGSWAGGVTASTPIPSTMQVDYVRAYATAATKYVSGTAAIGLGAPAGQGSITGTVGVGTGAGNLLGGVTVNLLNSSGSLVATTTTDGHGDYEFADLNPDTYTVQEVAPAHYALSGWASSLKATVTAGAAITTGLRLVGAQIKGYTLLDNGTTTTPVAGVTVTLLDSAGKVVATTISTNSNAKYPGQFTFYNLADGSYTVHYVVPSGEVLESGPADSSGNVAVTLGVAQTVTLGAETLSTQPTPPSTASLAGSVLLGSGADAGVRVTLLDGAGQTVATTTTQSDGSFTFTGLAAGAYQLSYTAPSGEVLLSGPADPATGLTPALTVLAGQDRQVAAETLGIAPASLSGSVVLAGVGQAGVAITLFDASGNSLTTTTAADGSFSFANLAPGSYQLSYTAPSGEVLLSGPADPTTGLTPALTVLAGQDRQIAAETLGPAAPPGGTGVLAGSVVTSASGSAAAAASGVAVALLDSIGATIATTTTGADGSYSFGKLTAGTYQLDYTPPAGSVLELGEAADPASGLTGPVTVGSGTTTLAPQDLLTIPASLGGTVKHFGPGDPGSGQPGVGVTLLDATGGTVATTTTDSQGTFRFYDLAAGTYQLKYATPTGLAIQPNRGSDATGLSKTIALQPGFNFNATHVDVYSTSLTTLTLSGDGTTTTLGDGNYVVTGAMDGSTLTLGNGNQSIALTGTGDTVTVGTGSSSISVRGGNAAITAGAGGTTVDVTKGGNTIDVGAGANAITTHGGDFDVFVLNGAGQGLTTISGFAAASHDMLDLSRTLAGLGASTDLSDIGSYITSQITGGSTMLSVTTPGNAPYAFAQLTGTATTVEQLVFYNELRVS